MVDGSSSVATGDGLGVRSASKAETWLQWVAPALCVGLAVASIATLRALPYSTSLIRHGDAAQAGQAPGQSFALGSLSWDLDAYQRAHSLDAFRDSFGSACGSLQGLEAARCVLEIIRGRSDNGAPTSEFVDAEFDPSAVLLAHLNGAPGHCTSRSFMTATALLAMGKPARVAQLLAPNSEGHNVIEVFDPQNGWLIFDPHYESSVLQGDGFVSTVTLTQVHGGLRWRRPNDHAPDPNLFAGSTVNFPDPWLYTRVGERCAVWPFRGCFEQIGPVQFSHGPAQKLALSAFFVFSALAAVLTVRTASRRRA